MHSTMRLRSTLLMAALLAPMIGCWRNGAQPVQPTVEVPVSCLTPKILADKPHPLDPTTLCGPGISVVDCYAYQILLRDAYIARLVANCGGGK